MLPFKTVFLHSVLVSLARLSQRPGKKEYTPPPWHPPFPGLSPDPEVTEQKKAMVHTIFLGKQGKRVYTVGPERRVFTIEASDPEKEKRRVSTVVVYTLFFPAKREFENGTLKSATTPKRFDQTLPKVLSNPFWGSIEPQKLL